MISVELVGSCLGVSLVEVELPPANKDRIEAKVYIAFFLGRIFAGASVDNELQVQGCLVGRLVEVERESEQAGGREYQPSLG